MMISQDRLCSRRYLRHGMLLQLVAFEAVVRLGGATRAAEALCMAQPTVSGHLRKLADSLGVPLFALRGKRLVPTEAAGPLMVAVHEMFAALERCEQDLAALREADERPAPCAAAGRPELRLARAPGRPAGAGREFRSRAA